MSRFAVSNFDIKQLRTFLAVVEYGGISAAAYRTGASLSSISRDLSALETRLGIALCRRGRSGFALTPQGEDVHSAATQLLSDLHSFEQRIQSTRQTLGGTFSLGVIDNVITNPQAGVVGALSEMHRLFPDMLINVSVHTVSLIDVQVRERKLDFAITGQREGLEPLTYEPAFVEEQRLYMSRHSPYLEAARDMVRSVWGSDAPTVPYISRAYRTDVFSSFENKYPLHVAARGSTLESILASVLAGVGCALLPSHFVERVGLDDLIEIATPDTPVIAQFHLVYRSDAADKRVISALLSRLRKA
jgi:DNA-binding transcriptional LysR family regulator